MSDKKRFHHSFFLVFFGLLCCIFLLAPNNELLAQTLSANATGKVIQVGASRDVKSLAAAARLARDGDTVEVDAGEYSGDVAVWQQDRLRLRAVGGRVRLVAAGKSAEGKGIWVLRGGAISIEGFDFVGATAPHRNGAGIRLEKGQLRVVDCRFLNNENGILTGGHPETTLEIQGSEFGYNGFGDGQSHNLYVGPIALLKVSGSYFHHAQVGHLLKSRAEKNLIFYNRLTDEVGGRASYELEFPNGGLAYVVGNIIQQSSTTENPNIVSFGAEGYRTAVNRLYLVNNTLVDMRPQGGQFLRAKPGSEVVAVNNILLGKSRLEDAGTGDYRNNFNVDLGEFVLALREDYHLRSGSGLIGKAIEIEAADGIDLKPQAEYQHPRAVRPLNGRALNPGALQ